MLNLPSDLQTRFIQVMGQAETNISHSVSAVKDSQDEHARALEGLLIVSQGDATIAMQELNGVLLQAYSQSTDTILQVVNTVGDRTTESIAHHSERIHQMSQHLDSVTRYLTDVETQLGSHKTFHDLASLGPEVSEAMGRFVASLRTLWLSSRNTLAHFV